MLALELFFRGFGERLLALAIRINSSRNDENENLESLVFFSYSLQRTSHDFENNDAHGKESVSSYSAGYIIG